MNERTEKLRAGLLKQKLNGIIITDSLNRKYISGFTGSAGVLVITHKKNFLLTDFRYTEQAKKETVGFNVMETMDIEMTLYEVLKKEEIGKIGFESKNITIAYLEKLKTKLKKIKIIPTLDLVENIREMKETGEIDCIKKAMDITISSLNSILALVKPGVSERDLALELEYRMRKNGAEKAAFDLIVASGERSSMPHAKTSDKKLRNRELVLFDIGADYNGYNSDLTRTFCLGIIDEKQKKIYDIVYKARKEAISKVKSGIETNTVDSAARDFIKKSGYGKFFGHGVGHGVGLGIHEMPQINMKKGEILKENMVVTIEPGIYIPNWGGIRIEDMVIVKKNGSMLISCAPEKLISL